MRAFIGILALCGTVFWGSANATCVPYFYVIHADVVGPTKQSIQSDFWSRVNPTIGNRCVLVGVSRLSKKSCEVKNNPRAKYKGRIHCMYELNNGKAPATVGLGALIDSLDVATPVTGGKGAVTLTSASSEITCKAGGTGGCVCKACSGGTMCIPNCKGCSP